MFATVVSAQTQNNSEFAFSSEPTINTNSPFENGEFQEIADLKSDLEALLQVQADCWNKGDIDGFMETYWKSEKLTFCSGGSLTRGWQPTIDRYKKSYDTRAKMGTLHFAELEANPMGDDSAVVLGTWKLSFEPIDTEEVAEPVGGRFTLILRKFDNGWKIIHDHTSTESKPANDDGEPR